MKNPTWATNAQGISLGGYGLSLRTLDVARLGQLYLQKGKWQGQQLLPSAWVDLATARQVSYGSNPLSDSDQGYGFQFWRSRHGAYRGDGAFGQYCLVMPAQDAVLAITAGLSDESVAIEAGRPSVLILGFAGRKARIDLGHNEWKTGAVRGWPVDL